MQILEISPPKQIILGIPNDLVRKVSLTNLTLRPIYIKIFKSHQYQLTVYPQKFLLEAFQQIKIQIIVNLNQNALQFSKGKIKIYFWQVKDQENHSPDQILNDSFNEQIFQRQIQISLQVDKTVQIFNKRSNKKKYFQIQQLLSPKLNMKSIEAQKQKNQVQKTIFQICQTLGPVRSIDNLMYKYIIEYKDLIDRCQFLQLKRESGRYLYVLNEIIQYGQKQKDFPNLICITNQQNEKKSQKKFNKQKKNKKENQKENQKFEIKKQPENFVIKKQSQKAQNFTIKQQPEKIKIVMKQPQLIQKPQLMSKTKIIKCLQQKQTKRVDNDLQQQQEQTKIYEKPLISLKFQEKNNSNQQQEVLKQQIGKEVKEIKQNIDVLQKPTQFKVESIQILKQQTILKCQNQAKTIQIQKDTKKQQRIEKNIHNSLLYQVYNKQSGNDAKKNNMLRQSFAINPASLKGIRRNKSQQKKYSSEYNYDQIKENTQTQNFLNNRLGQDFENKSLSNKAVVIHYKQTIIQPMKHILALYIQKLQTQEIVYFLLRDSLIFFDINDQINKKTIKFDPIDEQNLHLPTPLIMYKNQQIIFGNEGFIYWININNSSSQWKYVQRKQIYCLQTINQLNLLAVGGKNFSKFSYFGKQTSRSNLKLYSCGKKQKNHLFTYDIPGEMIGNVINMAYITTIPTNIKLLLVHTNYHQQNNYFHFLRIKAYNNIQVYGKFEIQQLGLQHITTIKYNQQSQKVIVLEQLNQQNSALKKIKIKSNYQKVQLFTQSLKIEPGSYTAFQMGGGTFDNYSVKQQEQWYCICDSKGKHLNIYYPQKQQIQKVELRKGQTDAYLLMNGKYLLLKGKTYIRIREKEIRIN